MQNRFAKLTQAFALFAVIAVFAAAAFPSASQAAAYPAAVSSLTGKVSIFVLDSVTGKPIKGASVTLQTSELSRVPVTGFTDVNGAVSFELREGLYTAIINAKYHKPTKEVVKVAAGEYSELKVALQPETISTPPTPVPSGK
jgi:5-hydroxyisourate hydrolase-like protein (transthyretin family)